MYKYCFELYIEVYSEPCKTSKIKRFKKTVNGFEPLNVWIRPWDITSFISVYFSGPCKSHKHNEILVRSMKQYTIKNLKKHFKKSIFQCTCIYQCLYKYTCIYAPYSWQQSHRWKRLSVKANAKPWFDSEIFSAIQKRIKQYSRYKRTGLETDKGKFKISKLFLHKRCFTE